MRGYPFPRIAGESLDAPFLEQFSGHPVGAPECLRTSYRIRGIGSAGILCESRICTRQIGNNDMSLSLVFSRPKAKVTVYLPRYAVLWLRPLDLRPVRC